MKIAKMKIDVLMQDVNPCAPPPRPALWLGRLVWMAPFALPQAAFGQAQVGSADTDPGPVWWIAILACVVLIPLLIWGVRRLLLRRIQQQMMVASAEELPANTAAASELWAGTVPTFDVRDADRAPACGCEARQRREREALQLFRRVCGTDLVAALLYAALPALLSRFEPNAVTAGLFVAFVIVAYTAVRYLLHRRQFRAFDLRRSRRRQRNYQRLAKVWRGVLVLISVGSGATAYNLVYVPDILRALFSARMRTWLSIGVALTIGLGSVPVAIVASGAERLAAGGFALAAIAHLALFTVTGRRLRDLSGIRLLILRVFNIDSTSEFVFSGLMKYWRHFGSHFAIVDPSLVRQGFSNSMWRTTFIWAGWCVSLLTFVVVTTESLGEPSSWLAACALVAGPPLVVAGAVLVIGRHRIDTRFTRNHDQIVTRLQTLMRHPRHFDLSFRNARVLCHDNTWFPAVVEFASRSQAVLMDLRGYTPARKGCEREVDFLFDAVALQRLLFLIGADGEETAVRQMLLDRWAYLQESSPNLKLRTPVVQLYRTLDNDKRDMQAIIDCLIEIADAPAAA